MSMNGCSSADIVVIVSCSLCSWVLCVARAICPGGTEEDRQEPSKFLRPCREGF